MCCFSRPVESVSATNIFARSAEKSRQILVYSMTLSAGEDLAMVLPLPVPADTPEDALKWINLKGYPDFFKDVEKGFPPPPRPPSDALALSAPQPRALAVVEVGDFEASFVPSEKDFARLDERFRLPATPPAVKGFGFAVFKLKKGEKTIHPMAFDFPRADPDKIFFPTVHIHDGEAHEYASFDHTLYAQGQEGERHDFMDWRESPLLASAFIKVARAPGVVDGKRHVHRQTLRGYRKNADIVV
jgi:hypothetical protein